MTGGFQESGSLLQTADIREQSKLARLVVQRIDEHRNAFVTQFLTSAVDRICNTGTELGTRFMAAMRETRRRQAARIIRDHWQS